MTNRCRQITIHTLAVKITLLSRAREVAPRVRLPRRLVWYGRQLPARRPAFLLQAGPVGDLGLIMSVPILRRRARGSPRQGMSVPVLRWRAPGSPRQGRRRTPCAGPARPGGSMLAFCAALRFQPRPPWHLRPGIGARPRPRGPRPGLCGSRLVIPQGGSARGRGAPAWGPSVPRPGWSFARRARPAAAPAPRPFCTPPPNARPPSHCPRLARRISSCAAAFASGALSR